MNKMLSGTIVPNEPKPIRCLFPDLIECPNGYDITLFTKLGRVGIERKKVPSDLLSSIDDGRLGKEILAMRDECVVMIVLFHGRMKFDQTGQLNQGRYTKRNWTDKGIRNLRRTIQFVDGCYIEDAFNNAEMVRIVSELQEYLDDDMHLSTKGRTALRTDWVKSTYQERLRYFYDGLPGVAITGAQKLATRFKTPMELYGASVEEIMEIPRMGKTVSTGIYNFLRGIY